MGGFAKVTQRIFKDRPEQSPIQEVKEKPKTAVAPQSEPDTLGGADTQDVKKKKQTSARTAVARRRGRSSLLYDQNKSTTLG
jgi:hypothetical protein